MRILFVVNSLDFLMSHRGELVRRAVNEGFTVGIVAPASIKGDILKDINATFYDLDFSRGYFSFWSEIRLFFALLGAFLDFRPDIAHMITFKSYFYGGIISRFIPQLKRVFAISGAGPVFRSDKGIYLLIRFLLSPFIRFSFGGSRKSFIFQNYDDMELFINRCYCDRNEARIFPGSGVDLDVFAPKPFPSFSRLKILFASRLLIEKGILEFLEAAASSQMIDYDFFVAGSIDLGNRHCISIDVLERFTRLPNVFYLGEASDMSDLINNMHVVVLPTYYGEGIPKVLLEAAACGRPVITSRHSGPADAVVNNVSGLLILPRDPVNIVNAIFSISDETRIVEMGREARRLAVEKFSVHNVVELHFKLYDELNSNSR